MKRINTLLSILVLGLFSTGITPAQSQTKVSLYDELAALYPDTRIKEPVPLYTLYAARGTTAAVHLLFTGLKAGEEVQFEVSRNIRKPVPNALWFRMIDVPVTENTGLDSRTEKWSGQVNPYVIRRAPFRIYEAFEPVTSPLKQGGNVLGLRLEIPVDGSVTAGMNTFDIKVRSGTWHRLLKLKINVADVSVPPAGKSAIHYVNWHNIRNMARDNGVELWSEPFWEVLRNYAKLMAKGRQNTFWFIWSDFFNFDPDGSIIEFYRDRLERYISIFLEEGLTTIQGAPFCGRRNWETDAFLVSVPTKAGLEIPALSKEGKLIILRMAGDVVGLMKETGWESRWYQGIFDEPTDEYVDRYKEVVAFLRTIKPDIRILEATMTVSLSGVVNCWCPQVQEYQANRDFFEARKAAGDEVWVYTCLIPGGPWINRLVDQERLRQVYVGWALAKYDLQGFLHWGLNFNNGKAYEELVRQHGGPTNFLPAGDSHIIYPGKNGPVSSQRFEAHRIGMEDYELLMMLKRKNPAIAEELIGRIFQAFDQYDTDIPDYRNVKAQLLKDLK